MALVHSSLVNGQDKPFTLINEDDGLAGNNVHDVVRDELGFLWIGTDNGLSKYDGERFANYRISQGMPGNLVWSLAVDDQKRVYAACYQKGLAIIENNVVKKVFHLKGRFADSFRKLYYSKTYQTLFVGTDLGLFYLKDSTFIKISPTVVEKTKLSVLSIIEHGGAILYTIHSENDSVSGIFRIDFVQQNMKQPKVTTLLIGNKGFGCAVIGDNVYANSFHRIFKLCPGSSRAIEFTQTDRHFLVWCMTAISKNELLLGGYGEREFSAGIKLLDVSNGKVTSSPFSIGTPSINNIVYDGLSSTILVCSENGLFFLKSSPFEVVDTFKTGIKDISEINDSIFVLTTDNIYQYYKGHRIIYRTINDLDRIITKKRHQTFALTPDKTKKSFKKLMLHFAKDEELVKLSHFIIDKDLLYLVSSKGTISIKVDRPYLPITSGKFTTDNKEFVLWVPDYNILCYFPHYGNNTATIPFKQGNQGDVRNVQEIINNGDVIYFASYFNGLFAVKDGETYYLNSGNSKIDDNISDIDIAPDGGVWCTSNYGNLFRIYFKDSLRLIQSWNERTGGIIGDNYKWLKFTKDFLYIGTNAGLNKIPINQLYQKEIQTVYFYNKTNGYNFISASTPVSDNEGNIYVHTSDHLIKIAPTSNSHPAKNIVFTEIQVNNGEMKEEIFSGASLPFTTNSVKINYALIKFPSSANVRYRYKVNEGEWLPGNSILLQSIKPGKYRIICEAKDLESSMVAQKEINFQIGVPFWQAWWFLVLVFLLILMVIYFIISRRFTIIKRREAEKVTLTRKISELQIQALQAQMNPHFVFNSLNSIQKYILSNKMEDAATYLGIMGSIIRMNLENVSKDYIPLADEISFISKYAEIEKMRFKKDLEISIANKVEKPDEFLIPPMLIQPLIENSIKHGIRNLKRKGIVSVNFDIIDKSLQVMVIDNGVGRNLNKTKNDDGHISYGLELIRERLKLLSEKNGTDKFQISITDLFENGVPAGTQVFVNIPVNISF